MKISASAANRNGKKTWTLLKNTELKLPAKLSIVEASQKEIAIEDGLSGNFYYGYKSIDGLQMSFRNYEAFGLQGSYLISIYFSSLDIAAIVEAATEDALLADYVLKKCRQLEGKRWHFTEEKLDEK